MKLKKSLYITISILIIAISCTGESSMDQASSDESAGVSKVWVADKGDGTFKNPVIHADYSDPDVVRVNDDYYMVSSSFNCVPSLPVLHSKDLVNWEIIGHVSTHLKPNEFFSKPQHGNGVWAPAFRYHNGMFYIYYGDPDFGVFMTKAKDPAGTWSDPLLVQEGKGWIDPCPFWDDDGNAYLVRAWAGSRSGRKSVLLMHRMNQKGTELLDKQGVIVFDGHDEHRTVEGPKMYKRGDYYYIFAPAGGVTNGWQLALRSKNVFGPYEEKTVLHQGNTSINGPHQGAWVETQQKKSWFIHFQDKGPYGRIVHLQPMKWEGGWPMMGVDQNNDGIGEPVDSYRKPTIEGEHGIRTPQASDEFNEPTTGLQWQWHANPEPTWGGPTGRLGYYRLYCELMDDSSNNLWDAPNLFMQKFTAPAFTATAKVTFNPLEDGDRAGLIIFGMDYAYLGVQYKNGNLYLNQTECIDAEGGSPEQENERVEIDSNHFYLRVDVKEDAICNFKYSMDGEEFHGLGRAFEAKEGKWIGAKVGFFANGEIKTNDTGYLDIDWFRVQ